MTPVWFRNWKIIYDRIPAQRINEFEVIKDGINITLLEHSDPITNWMANCASEWRLYKILHRLARGNVLIAGLGLGFDAISIASKSGVDDIVIVERNGAVINLVWSHIPKDKTILVHQDISEYLLITRRTFDIIYFDIFPGGHEPFPRRTEELRAIARPKLRPNGQIIFFTENPVYDHKCSQNSTSKSPINVSPD
jgi:spermidine synthase